MPGPLLRHNGPRNTGASAEGPPSPPRPTGSQRPIPALQGFSNTRLLDPTPEGLIQEGLGRSPRICSSNKTRMLLVQGPYSENQCSRGWEYLVQERGFRVVRMQRPSQGDAAEDSHSDTKHSMFVPNAQHRGHPEATTWQVPGHCCFQ